MDALIGRLLSNAYLFDDPASYEAGVLDTLAVLGAATERQHEDEEQISEHLVS